MGGKMRPARFLVLAVLLLSTLVAPNLASAQILPPVLPPQILPTNKVDPALQSRMTANPLVLLPVIVEMTPPTAPFGVSPKLRRATEALDLLRLNGLAVGTLPILNAAAGWANAAGIAALALAPGVAYVHEDAVVRQQALPAPDGVSPGQLSAPYPRTLNADRAWREGITGRGVSIAVLDSGVAPDADLVQRSGRLVASVNFAGSRETADPGGHGTHVAGIAAGDGQRSGGEYVGVAPEAGIVDVRVLNGTGSGRVSSIVAGIQWAVANRDKYGIRVLNLSLGAPASRPYQADPLAAAVEIAWKRGLVVVVAAGNDGPDKGTVQTPGIDPYVVTVGATDDNGSAKTGDDALAFFSAWGTPPGSTPKPDLVAPGRRVVSIRTPGSYLDRLYADRVTPARNGSTYFRLTGTSMSTPMVAGAVALLLQRQPELTPDQVKAILTATVQRYGREPLDPLADGAGLLDAYAAATSGPRGTANRQLRPSDVAARAVYSALHGQPLVWRDPSQGGTCWVCLSWDSLIWNDGVWDNLAWDAFSGSDGVWDDGVWDDGVWDDGVWDDGVWDRSGWDAGGSRPNGQD